MPFWGMGFGRGRRRGKGKGRGMCWWYWQNYDYIPPNQGYGGPWGYGWRPGWGGRFYGWTSYQTQYPTQYPIQTAQQDTSKKNQDIGKRARDLINRAYTVEPFPGAPWLQIMADGKIIGYLWERVDLKSLSLGTPTSNGNYWSVPLLLNGRIVGYIYLN